MCCWVGFQRQRRWRLSWPRSLWKKPRETSGTQASRPPDRNRHRAPRPHHHRHSSKLQLKESPKSDSRAILRRPIAIIAFPLNNIALIRNDARVDIAFEWRNNEMPWLYPVPRHIFVHLYTAIPPKLFPFFEYYMQWFRFLFEAITVIESPEKLAFRIIS